MLRNTTLEGDLLDYAFQTQYCERRIEYLLESAWEKFGIACLTHGFHVTDNRSYIIAVSYEG